MSGEGTALKIACNPEFTAVVRAIIYSPRLHWGAKVLALALLDLPLHAQPTNAALARKLHSSASQVSCWRQELIRNGVNPRKQKF